MKNIHKNPLIIIDFGSQYTQLIARRIRELSVYTEVYSPIVDKDIITKIKPTGIILSGGPASISLIKDLNNYKWIFEQGVPVLGICYGMQLMAQLFGGKVSKSKQCEYGYAKVTIKHPSNLLSDIEDRVSKDGESILDVWMSHGDQVVELPKGFKTLCITPTTPVAGMVDEGNNFYALQFHPEVTHTLQGMRVLKNFVIDICKAETNWTAKNIIQDAISHINKIVGDDKVLLALSGGVDSSVVAALLHKAIGAQLVCVFVDTGLLRHLEAREVEASFKKNMGVNLITVEAEEEYLTALSGVSDPEQKRKIIGKKFIEIFEREAKTLDDIKWLAQGTIYPDVIESAATSNDTHAEVIKSHHNVGGLPDIMNLKLIEPLRELFKDEVRKIGLELGLPYEMVYRHPFPGPGLGVRILGEVKKEYADILRKADHIFIEELRAHSLYDKVAQAFAVFLPIKTVGVMGDGRRYDYVIALRAVETTDYMTASYAELPWDFISLVSNRIINEIRGVSRVTYDVSSKPPATIEWE